MATIRDFIKEYYKIDSDFNVRATNVVVYITNTLVLKNNPNRLAVLLINVGTNPIYLNYSNTAVVNQGILLSANGGNMSVNFKDDFTLPENQIYGIAQTAFSNLYIVEILTT